MAGEPPAQHGVPPADRCDVVVARGGPPGPTAASRPAGAGASVVGLERQRFPRDKPCGGGVTGRAAGALPFSIDPVVEDVVDTLEGALRYGRRVTRRATAPLAYMTQRKRLDHFLLEKAAAAGADVRDGVKVGDIRSDGLTVDGDDVRARVVIGADGCNGASAKQLGLAREVAYGVALEANFPYDARYAHTMLLEMGVIRGGYGWIFPKGDHLNLGVGGNESEGPKLRRELERLCRAYGFDPDAATAPRGYRLPMRRPSSRLAAGTAAVIGDAAGL